MRDDGVTEQLHTAEVIIQNYKTKQKIAGDSWQMYHGDTGTNTEYDIFYTGLTASSTFNKMWKVSYQIEGGRTIPNAFAIFMDKVGGLNEDSKTAPHQLTPGFFVSSSPSGTDPLAEYVAIGANSGYTADANSYAGIKLRAISPYKGKIIFEEMN